MMYKSIAKSVGMMPISENHDVEVFVSEDGKKGGRKPGSGKKGAEK